MDTTNPYDSTPDVKRSPLPKSKKSIVNRLLIGFCVGASIPASMGAYGLYQFNVYVASLPPEEFVCGNMALLPMMLIMFGAPLLGLIGAVISSTAP